MQRIGEFRETFRSVCEKLSSRVREINVRLREYSQIDMHQFRQLKSEGKTPHAWDFSVELRYDGRAVKFMFWHGRYWHHARDTRILSNAPVLLVSIEEGGTFRTLQDAGEEAISLRAVAIENGEFVRVRFDPVKEVNEFDEGIHATTIVRDFVQEVLRSKLGIA